MVNYNDLARLWGEGNVCRLEVGQLEGISMPERAKAALHDLGLPRKAEPLFMTSLGRNGSLPVAVRTSRQPGHWWQIGSDGETVIGVEAGSGVVMSISPSGEYPDRFVNSDLDAFITFLYLVGRARAMFPGRSDEAIDAEVERLEGDLLQLDPVALTDPNNWWSMIMEQLKDGLL